MTDTPPTEADLAELERLATAWQASTTDDARNSWVDQFGHAWPEMTEPPAILALVGDLRRLRGVEAERDNLRWLLALLWQRINEPREGDVKPGAGLFVGYGPQLSAKEFREIRAALKEGKQA